MNENRSYEEMVNSGSEADLDAVLQAAAEHGVVNDNQVEQSGQPEMPTQQQFEQPAQPVVDPAQSAHDEQRGVLPQENLQPPVGQAPVDNPMYSTLYRKNEVQVPDPDGFLGYKNEDGLKKAVVHKEQYLRDIQTDFQKQQEYSAQLAKELEETKAKLNSFNQPVQGQPQFQQVQQPTQQQPVQQTQTTQQYTTQQDFSLPESPLDWENNHVQQLQQKLQNPHDPRVDQINQRLEKYDKMLEEREQEHQRKLAEEADKRHWQDINTFKDSNPIYKVIPGDIREYDRNVNMFMDQVAIANGVRLMPGATQTEINNYNAQKTDLAKKFVEGDMSVINNSQGIAAPQGIREFFDLAGLINERRSLPQEVQQKFTLNDMWAMNQHRNGAFEQVYNQGTLEAQQQGAQMALNAVNDVKANHATTLPSNVNQQPPQSNNAGNLTDAQVLSLTPQELQRNPELAKRHGELLSGR